MICAGGQDSRGKRERDDVMKSTIASYPQAVVNDIKVVDPKFK